MKGFPDLPPIWTLAVALLAIFLSRMLPILTVPTPATLSWALISLGFVLIIWSAIYFLLKKTSIEPHHTPQVLIVEGPYKVSRNPIYLGMFLGLLGVAFWTNTLIALLVVCIFPIVIAKRFINQEEAALRAQFHEAAEAYLSSTGRWFVWF